MTDTKKENDNGRVQLRLSAAQLDYIDQIIYTENFGDNRAAVVTYLLSLGIKEMVKEGYVKLKRKPTTE